ncbi:MAG: nucleotidyltransferase domain-containing protein [Anaerolineales bacterium]|nr:nucleotidyltransferase domain-containing protein [Anaerolineales bacterium]
MESKIPENIQNLLKELKDGLVSMYGDRLKDLYLYGSYARGDYRQGSDLDVMILLADFKNYWDELERSTELASDLSLKYDVTLSRLIIKEIQWKESDMPVLRNIRTDGVLA